jgi:hypothetical protein
MNLNRAAILAAMLVAGGCSASPAAHEGNDASALDGHAHFDAALDMRRADATKIAM